MDQSVRRQAFDGVRVFLELTERSDVIDIFDVEIEDVFHVHVLQTLRQIGNGSERAFGFLFDEEVFDGFRVDHLVVELGYVHFLEVGVDTASVDGVGFV